MVKLMKLITRWLKITCADTSPLISEVMDHTLPFSKRWRLKLHLAICEACRYYEKQLSILRALGRKLGREETEVKSDVRLSDECKERMKDALQNSP